MADDLADTITSTANQYGVDPALALAIAQHGEGYGQFPTMAATSGKGARGTFQLMPTTAATLKYGPVDPNDPQQNIVGGVRYIRELQDQYGANRPDLIAAGYNAGPGAVAKYGGVPPYPETQGYVQRVTGALSGQPAPNADEALPDPSQVLGGYGGAKGVPAPAGNATAASGADTDLPDPSQVLGGYGAPKAAPATPGQPGPPAQPLPTTDVGVPGNRNVNQVGPGVWKDPTTGHTIVADPSGPGFYRDTATGALFQDTAQMNAGQPTLLSVAGQAGRGILDAAESSGNQTLATALPNAFGPILKSAADQTDNIGRMISTAFTGQAPAQPIQNPAAIALANGSGGAITVPPDIAAWQAQQPQNIAERAARTVGQFAPGLAFGPEGEAGLAAQVARRVGNVVVPAATSEAAGDTAEAVGLSAEIQQGVRFGAGLAGGLAFGAGPGGARAMYEGGRNVVGNAFGPFAAALSDSAAAKQAAGRLATTASDPAALRASVAGGAQEIVPGSKPTLFQQSGDLGIGAAEKAASNTSEGKTALAARAATQNQARVSALGGIQSNADPAAVSQFVTGKLNDIDVQTQGALDAATHAAQAKTGAMGGDASPEAQGAALRQSLADAHESARQQTSALYQAVDPDGTLTGNVQATKAAAKDVLSQMQPTSAPMEGQEAQAFKAAAAMPDVAPLKTLTELRSNVGAQMASELRNSGATPAYARLSRLYGAIQDNLGSTIADAVQSDQAKVAAGEISPEQAIAARIQAQVDDFRARQAAAIGAPSARNSGATGPGGSLAIPNADGTEGAPVGGPGSAAGSPSGNPGAPTIDADALGRLNAASAAAKAQHETFDAKPVGGILKTNGRQGAFATPDSAVPGQVWTGRPGELEAVQAAVKAGGPAAETAISDFAASDLRRAATNPDGSINPTKFAAWQAKHAGGLKALPPEVQAKFASAASAGQAVADASVARVEALKAAQQGATAKLIGLQDPDAVTRTVGNLFSKPTAAADMRSLVQATSSNPDAVAGLRQAVADHIAGKLISNTESATSGTDTLKSDQFQTFVKANRAALKQVFTPEEMQSLDNIAADLHRSARSANALKTAGSDTELNRSLSGRMGTLLGHRALGVMGMLLGGSHGAEGGGLGYVVGETAQHFRQVGVDKVQTLFSQALLDPDVAKALLAKLPANATAKSPVVEAAKGRLFSALANASAVSSAANSTVPQPLAQPVYQPAKRMRLNAFQ